MVESDCSETEEGDMERLQLSSDSVSTISPKKRLRVENSEDEVDLPAKKRQSFFSEQSRMIKNDNAETISDKVNTDVFAVVEEKYTLCPKDKHTVQEIFQSEPDMDKKSKAKRNGKLKRENGDENILENDNSLNDSSVEISVQDEVVANKDNPLQKLARNTNVMSIHENKKIKLEEDEVKEGGQEEIDETIDGNEDSEEDEMRKQHTVKRHTVNTEVVDGLELSVECASDKDESSSESKDEKNVTPRPRTIIVKAEPNESELDCSSDGEKSESQRAFADTLEIKSEKSKMKRSSRTSFSKLKVSGSEASQNSNSDEDYSPRTKKKIKKSSLMTKRSTNKHRSVESERGRGRGMRKNSHKKNAEYIPDEDEASCVTVVERANKTTKTKDGMEKELSEKESSSKDESDNNSEKEESSMKGRRKRSNVKPQDRYIQALKKYLNVAGVKVKSYNEIWADCKSHAAKIKRLKELLEKNGVSGRPTLEKCKRVREENEKMKEVSELDTSNIISEGRVTRARRNMENVKKTPPDTPPRHREARNTFKRIQTVVDSESE